MGRKKKNNLKRIEKNSNFNSKRQRPPTHTNNDPGEEIIVILESESPPLSDEELEIIQSMPGVYFRPRTRKQTIISDGTLKRWQLLGLAPIIIFWDLTLSIIV